MPEDLFTIVYYTSNREDREFEEKIIDNLKKQAGSIPIISVSQKPINLGKNICVGDVGFSYLNEWRQILIGAKEATTPYIIFAESDFLYPKDYFTLLKDPKAGLYRYDNVWIVLDKKYGNSYKRKNQSEGAQICKRELLIERYEKFLQGQPDWFDGNIIINRRSDNPLTGVRPELYGSDIPCVSFKTGNGVRYVTNFMKGEGNSKIELPYWGGINKIRADYLDKKVLNKSKNIFSMKFTKNWTTHMSMLIKYVEKTNGPVLELGSGLFSTPLLHWLCKMRGIKLVTYENAEEFYEFAKGFRSPKHKIHFIKNWDEIDLNTKWGVVFIDHHPPEQRGKDAIKFKDNADYIILHDSEREEYYGYDKAWPHFKHRFDWKECKPWTTVLSNKHDLCT